MPAGRRVAQCAVSRSPPETPARPYLLGLAGAFASLVGIGLGRFAYTPIIPALVHAHWFTQSQAAYLGAVNLLGYMLGAWGAHRAALWLGQRRVLAVNLAVLTLSLLACALDWGFVWYSLWRLLAGVTGAVLTVVATSAVMVRIPADRRPAVSAVLFTGVGVAIIASGTLVPWLAERGVVTVWLGIGLIALVLSLWSWFAVWRHLAGIGDAGTARATPSTPVPRAAVLLVIVAYGLDAAGIVPHSLFWVDYIARELALGLRAGGSYWVLFGIGAALGPALAGALAARIGFRPALVVGLAIAAAAVALPLVSVARWALVLSSLLVGGMLLATVTLTSGSVAELAPPDRQQQFWGWATLAFAIMQAVAGYAFSALYAVTGSYVPLFALGAGMLALAVAAAAGALRPA